MLIDQTRPPPAFPKLLTFLKIVGTFVLIEPFTTFVLIVLKGLPAFATSHFGEVVLWVYSVTWIPALLAGIFLGGLVVTTLSRTRYFHLPFDFGRAFSLGAVGGALMEALATFLYRVISHRLFHDFWIAGAMIAGCLAGGVIVAVVLWRLPRKN